MVRDKKFNSNDLVVLKNWDCEGIETPWGWEHHRFPQVQLIKTMKKADRIKLKEGMLGIILGEQDVAYDYDRHYILLVAGRQLGVPVRFIEPAADNQ